MYNSDSIRIYRTISGDLEPLKGDEFMACYYAYTGQLSNYIKVRKDTLHDTEELCLVHSMYFNLDFAIWWKNNMLGYNSSIDAAASAKLIMNNDLSYIHPDIFCIWYPDTPTKDTYRKLYKTHKEFAYQIAHGCMLSKYNDVFKEINVLPEILSLMGAEASNNLELYKYIKSRIPSEGLWKVVDESFGMVGDPIRVEDSSTCISPLTNDDMNLLYLTYKTHGYHIESEDITIDDFTCTNVHYDPLKTFVISDVCVNVKIKRMKRAILK
jgi:hypothetical protein